MACNRVLASSIAMAFNTAEICRMHFGLSILQRSILPSHDGQQEHRTVSRDIHNKLTETVGLKNVA